MNNETETNSINTPPPSLLSGNKKKIIIAVATITLLVLIALIVSIIGSNPTPIDKKVFTIEKAQFKSDSLYLLMKKDLANYKQNNEVLN